MDEYILTDNEITDDKQSIRTQNSGQFIIIKKMKYNTIMSSYIPKDDGHQCIQFYSVELPNQKQSKVI